MKLSRKKQQRKRAEDPARADYGKLNNLFHSEISDLFSIISLKGKELQSDHYQIKMNENC